MSVPPVLICVPNASALRAVAGTRPAATAGSFAQFDGESASEERVAQRRSTERRGGMLYQNGPRAGAPVWHGPLLKPSFVAQVLGQVMMTSGGDYGRRREAYPKSMQMPQGMLLDRGV